MTIANKVLDFSIKTLNRHGLHLMRSYRIPQSNLNLLDICLPSLLLKQKSLFFVQIGASDGMTNDPIFPLIEKYNLKGICVEPLPDVFEKLKSNYHNIPGINFENAALCDRDRDLSFYRPIDKSVSASQKSSFDKSNLLNHGFRQDQIEKILVKGISFNSLMAKYQITSVDILQVDTEGYDYETIKSVLESGVKPSIIHYESLHLNKMSRNNCRQLLTDNNYSFLETSKDTIAIKK